MLLADLDLLGILFGFGGSFGREAMSLSLPVQSPMSLCIWSMSTLEMLALGGGGGGRGGGRLASAALPSHLFMSCLIWPSPFSGRGSGGLA